MGLWNSLSPVSYLIDVLVSFDEVNREFPQWSTGRVSETRGDPPLEYGHIRQHLQRTDHTQDMRIQKRDKPSNTTALSLTWRFFCAHIT